MMRFFKSRSNSHTSEATVISNAKPRSRATVEGIRKKLADYQKTEGPARFIQPQELTYLKNGTIQFDAPGSTGEMTMGFAVPFSLV